MCRKDITHEIKYDNKFDTSQYLCDLNIIVESNQMFVCLLLCKKWRSMERWRNGRVKKIMMGKIFRMENHPRNLEEDEII